MSKKSLPDDTDFLAASAVAALAIAVKAGSQIKGDPTIIAWTGEVGELPSWRDDAHAWVRGLSVIQQKYNLPSDDELSSRTIEQALFNRVRSSALNAVLSGDQRARHFHLSMASIAAGSLLSGSSNARPQAAVIEKAVAAALSENASKMNLARKKVQAMSIVKAKFDEWRKGPGKYPNWRTYKDFGRWAEDEHGLDAAYVARKAGRWESGKN